MSKLDTSLGRLDEDPELSDYADVLRDLLRSFASRWKYRVQAGRLGGHSVSDVFSLIGRVDAAVAVLSGSRDTDHVQAEHRSSIHMARALAETEARFRMLVDSVRDYAIYMLDVDGRVTTWNEGAQRIKGYRSEEILGQHFSRFYTAEDQLAGKPAAALHSALVDGRFETEGLRVKKDGSRFFASVVVTALRDEHGRLAGFAKVTRDISEKRAADEALAARERLLRSVLEILPVGVWVTDEKGDIKTSNAVGQRIWCGAREMGPQHLSALKARSAETNEPIRPEAWPVKRAVEKGESTIGELVAIDCPNGAKKTIMHSVVPLPDSDGRIIGAVAVSEDVSTLRQTEDALRSAVRARENVLAVVSHDLRNPITSVLLGTQHLKARIANLSDDPRCGVWLNRMEGSMQRMLRLTDDLLDAARIDAGTLSVRSGAIAPVLDLVTEATEALLESACAKRVQLVVEPIEPELTIRCDPDRVHQVLSNLLGNAIKFSTPDGLVRLSVVQSGGLALFSVTDSGPGICVEDQEHVFERSWQHGDAKYGGAGLGLFIAKGLVEAQGGRIYVDSEPGRGTRLSFTIPLGAPLANHPTH